MSSLDKRPKLRKMDMKFGTWNVRHLYRTLSLMRVVRQSEYKLDLVGVQEVRWDRSGTEPAGSVVLYGCETWSLTLR
jgi:hypothetical protein